MKSIKEFAKELGVSDKTISRHIKKLNITTHRHGNVKQLDSDAQEQLRKALTDITYNLTDNQTDIADTQNSQKATPNRQTNGQAYNLTDRQTDAMDNLTDNQTDIADTQNSQKVTPNGQANGQQDSVDLYMIKAEMLQSQLEQMQSEIALLNEQLQVKDNQLNIKDKQIEQQLQTIQALTVQMDRLTTQIETAQQLNAGNIKALLNEQGKSVDAPEQEEQPQKKQGFFSRLFGKGKQ